MDANDWVLFDSTTKLLLLSVDWSISGFVRISLGNDEMRNLCCLIVLRGSKNTFTVLIIYRPYGDTHDWNSSPRKTMADICVGNLTIISSDNGLSSSHYLNLCWNIVNWTLSDKLQWNLYWNTYISIQENAIENIVSKMAAILSRLQCDKQYHSCGYIATQGNHRPW